MNKYTYNTDGVFLSISRAAGPLSRRAAEYSSLMRIVYYDA